MALFFIFLQNGSNKVQIIFLIGELWNPEGLLSDKYPGGLEVQKKLLEKKGFTVTQKGKKYFVENYQKYLK